MPAKLKRYIVTTFISAKGLEFDTVITPRMNFFRYPDHDPETRIREEMYVACTRARDRLLVSGVQPASEFFADFAARRTG